MIQPQELRIANYIEYNGEIIKLDGSLFCCYIQNELEFPIKPIHITEEILLKFGFEFRNNNKHYGWYLSVSQNRVLSWCHSKEISLEFDTDDYYYNNTLFDFHCEYVHQLQNLYFALTGEELTFKK